MAFKTNDIEIDGQSLGLRVKIITLDFGINGIYGSSSTNYVSIPIQVLVPKIADIDSFTKIEAKLCLDYNTQDSSTASMRLYNYTDSAVVPNSEKSLVNVNWDYGSSGWIDITAYEGKALRCQIKRVGGITGNQIQIEGALLILKLS